jgi:hypothetical protein
MNFRLVVNVMELKHDRRVLEAQPGKNTLMPSS